MEYTKRSKIKIILHQYYNRIRFVGKYFFAVLYSGTRFECPCCEGSFRKFLPAGAQIRLNAECPRCGSRERNRLLWLYLNNKTNLSKDRLKFFHIAPQWYIKYRLEKLSNLDYVVSPSIKLNVDITAIPLPDDQFDCIICCHVLEYIPDDFKAMKELFRVLKPGGWAILQSPVRYDLDKTIEDLSITSPKEQERLFGCKGHVRFYGRDYKAKLEQAGFIVKVDDYQSELGEDKVKKYALLKGEKVYFCSKNK